MSDMPRRGKRAFIVIIAVFIISMITFMVLEKKNFLDALYFLVITVTTVGYGDAIITQPFSQFIVIILILTGISSIAIFSEIILTRMIKVNMADYLAIPEKGIDAEGHVIIGGFSRVAEIVALIFQSRFVNTFFIDTDEDRVRSARHHGFASYFAEIESSQTLESLNLEKARGLFLFLNDENKTVQASIIARSINSDLPIFAETDHSLSIEIGNLVGINRTYHNERLLANQLRIAFTRISALFYPNQDLSSESQFRVMLATRDYEYKSRYPNHYPIGVIAENFVEFKRIGRVDIEKELEKEGSILFAIDKDDLREERIIQEHEEQFENIIICGFNPHAAHIFEELDFELFKSKKITILTFDEVECAAAKEYDLEIISCKRSELSGVIESKLMDTQVVINLFDKITDSLLLNTVIRNIIPNVNIVQIAHTTAEVDAYERSGANKILIPGLIMARGMANILQTHYKENLSIILGKEHLFEYNVKKGRPLYRKSIKHIQKLGYFVILWKKADSEIEYNPSKGTVQEGDSLLLIRHIWFTDKLRHER